MPDPQQQKPTPAPPADDQVLEPPRWDPRNFGARTAPLSTEFAGMVLPSLQQNPAHDVPLRTLHPTTVQQSIDRWMSGLPSQSLRGESTLQLSPLGMEFATKPISFTLGPTDLRISTQGYLQADWRDRLLPERFDSVLPVSRGTLAPHQGMLGEVWFKANDMRAVVATRDAEMIAGALQTPALDLFGRYEGGRAWDTLGRFKLASESASRPSLLGSFQASPDNHHIRIHLENASEATLATACGLELRRGIDFPGGSIAAWFGSGATGVSLRHDLLLDRTDIVISSDMIKYEGAHGIVRVDGLFDSRDSRGSVQLHYQTPERSTLQGFGNLRIEMAPDGKPVLYIELKGRW